MMDIAKARPDEGKLEAKPVVIGAAVVGCGVALVEVLIAAGVPPLGPLGWPGLFLILAGAFWGGSGALGGALVLVGNFLFTLGMPQRFPHFHANPGVLPFWFVGLGLAAAVAALLRARLMRAHALELEAAQQEADISALVDYREWLSTIIDNAPAMIGYIDAEQRFRFHNATYEHWLDKPKAEITGRSVREVFGEAEYRRLKPHLEQALRGGRVTFHHEHAMHGGLRHAQTSFVPDFDAQRKVRGCFVVAKDIGSVIAAQSELREARRRTEAALGGSNVELWEIDLQSGEMHLGGARTSLQAFAERIHAEDLEGVRAKLRARLKGGQEWAAEYRLRAASGEWRWVLSRGQVTQRDASGRALRIIGANVDIHERKLAEQALERRTQEEAVGDIATPSLLAERLRRGLARAQRSGAPLALLQVGIDGRRPTEEPLLGEIAARLRACVRLTDTVARMDGERFVLLLEGLKGRGDAFRVAEKILQTVRQPIAVEGGEIQLSASIGVAFPEDDVATAEELMRRAGAALSEAKAAGRDAYRVGKSGG